CHQSPPIRSPNPRPCRLRTRPARSPSTLPSPSSPALSFVVAEVAPRGLLPERVCNTVLSLVARLRPAYGDASGRQFQRSTRLTMSIASRATLLRLALSSAAESALRTLRRKSAYSWSVFSFSKRNLSAD